MVTWPDGQPNFEGERFERRIISQALHTTRSGIVAELGWVMRFPGLPQEDGRMIMAFAEQMGWEQPAYSPTEVAHFFFQSTRKGADWLYRKLAKYQPRPGDPYSFAPLDEKRSDTRWTLGDVERMIMFLSRERAIDSDRTIVSLWLVLWTAKGYGLYA